jgi:hypothetical protein
MYKIKFKALSMSKVRFILSLLVFIVTFAPAYLNASSDKAKQYLINEPISLLDFGIYKLRNKYSGFQINHGLEKIDIPLTVNYWKENGEIIIDGVFKEDAIILIHKRTEMIKKWPEKVSNNPIETFPKSFSVDPNNIKNACNGIVQDIRSNLGLYYMDVPNAKFDTTLMFKLLTLMFSHAGQNYTNVPFEIGKTVADMVHINLTYYYSDRDNNVNRSFKCDAKLAEKELKFHEVK